MDEVFANTPGVETWVTISGFSMMEGAALPNAVTAYNVFVYRSFYKGISPEIREAARIDGAGDLKILTKIYVPLSKALYATFGLFSVVGVWNSYYEALLYIKDPGKQPIQMLLRKIVFTSGTANMADSQQMISNGAMNQLNVQYACVIATIGPILLVYPFIQKYFAQGMQVGAVKAERVKAAGETVPPCGIYRKWPGGQLPPSVVPAQ